MASIKNSLQPLITAFAHDIVEMTDEELFLEFGRDAREVKLMIEVQLSNLEQGKSTGARTSAKEEPKMKARDLRNQSQPSNPYPSANRGVSIQATFSEKDKEGPLSTRSSRRSNPKDK